MSKEQVRGRSRRRTRASLTRAGFRGIKRFLSMLVCTSMVGTGVANTAMMAYAVELAEEKVQEFQLEGSDIGQAILKAASEGEPLSGDELIFSGMEEDHYNDLFLEDGLLYEIKPEIEETEKGRLDLRVFVRLDEENSDLDNYEITGDEDVLFMLVNKTSEEHTARIAVDGLETEEITVIPREMVQEVIDVSGPAQISAAGGAGGAGGAGTSVPDQEEGLPQESESAAPEESEASVTEETESSSSHNDENVPSEGSETGESSDIKESGEGGETGEPSGVEGIGEGSDAETPDEEAGGTSDDQNTSGVGDSGSEEADGNENTSEGDSGTSSGDSGTSSGDSGTSSGDSGTSSGDSGTSSGDSGDSSGDSNDLAKSASISVHKFTLVTTAATSSEASSVVEIATGSEAASEEEDENEEKTHVGEMSGELYDAVIVNAGSAVVFATTADELELQDIVEQKVVYTAETDKAMVTATAPVDAFDETVTMSAREVLLNTDEYQTLSSQISDNGYSALSFVAYDITFLNSALEEVEPNGEVKVSIAFKEAEKIAEVSDKAVETKILHVHEDKVTELQDAEISQDENVGISEVTFGTAEFSYMVLLASESKELISSGSLGGNPTDWPVSKSKEATNLDSEYKSRITLSLPAAEKNLAADVVFVIDKSTSQAKSDAPEMLESLKNEMEKSGADIKVGVVYFNAVAETVVPLSDLGSNFDTIIREITDDARKESGSNIHAGLLKAEEMLDNDESVTPDRKYMILISDGVTYHFNAETTSIVSVQYVMNGTTLDTAPSDTLTAWGFKYKDEQKITAIMDQEDVVEAVGAFLGRIKGWIESDNDNYDQPYGDVDAAVSLKSNRNSSGNLVCSFAAAYEAVGGQTKWEEDSVDNHANNVEKALYLTNEVYRRMQSKGYNCYAVDSQTAKSEAYPFGGEFIAYLADGQNMDLSKIENEIIYLLDVGSYVEDFMGYDVEKGYNFNFINNAGEIMITLGDKKNDPANYQELKATDQSGNGTYFTFGTANDGVYPYTLTYNPGNMTDTEHFVWNINVPVRQQIPVKLTYTVQLENPKTEQGTYGEYNQYGTGNTTELYTNNSAVLYPTDSNGTKLPAEEFLKPTVSYTIGTPEPSTPQEWEVSKSKTATNLDENFESKVTLSLPSATYKKNLDIAFVLDGSTSADEDGLAGQAAALLDELVKFDNLNVKVGLTVYGGSEPILYQSGGLLSLKEEHINLKKLLIDPGFDKMPGRSGSNLQAGVEIACSWLKADDTADMRDKYMIILSDGAARMWYSDGDALSQTYLPESKIFWNSNEDWIARYDQAKVYQPRTFEEVWSAGQNGENLSAYAMTEAQKNSAATDDPRIASWDTVKNDPSYYTTYEAATYYAAVSIAEAATEANVILVSYPYHVDTTFGQYIESFKEWLADKDIVTRYDSSDMSETDIFAKVKNDLLYVVDAGSKVVDVIGYTDDYNFDFINDINKFELCVGDSVLVEKKINDSTYAFGENNDFVLHYYKDGTSEVQGEHFVWDINVPVTKDKSVQLIYTVKLTNPKTASGTYGTYDENGSEGYAGLYTNNSATLYPVDSDGQEGDTEDFAKPTVSYKIGGGGGGTTDPNPPTDPTKPGDSENNGNDDNGSSGGGSTGGGGGGSSSHGTINTNTTIGPGQVPVAEAPADPAVIPEEEIPLAGLPKTGDTRNNAMVTLLFGMIAVAYVTLSGRKTEEE